MEKEQSFLSLPESWGIDASWTLFLDRDGVINERKMGGYIQSVGEFRFLPEVKEAISLLSKYFGRIVVVTNQQGIAKKIMTERNLMEIHTYMLEQVAKAGGKIDRCYFAPGLKGEDNELRKPKAGMAFQAQHDFPEIDFSRSVMVGDSDSDMIFGTNLGMKTVRIQTIEPIGVGSDLQVTGLYEWAKMFLK